MELQSSEPNFTISRSARDGTSGSSNNNSASAHGSRESTSGIPGTGVGARLLVPTGPDLLRSEKIFLGGFSESTVLDREFQQQSEEVGQGSLKPRKSWRIRYREWIAEEYPWITDNLTFRSIKPVIRSTVAGWVSLVLFLLTSVEGILGQTSFIIMIAAFLSPPGDPFLVVIEREVIILTFVASAFGWSCLGIFLASLARTQTDKSAPMTDIVSGVYIETGPTLICATFMVLGTTFYLVIKAQKGPGPFLYATFLGCTLLDLSLTFAPLFPYAYYGTGRSIMLAIAFHSAIALACSFLIFPETINAQFAKRLKSILVLLEQAIQQQPSLLKNGLSGTEEALKAFENLVTKAESGLGPLTGSGRLMKQDISWGRFAAVDLLKFQQLARSLTVRANGMSFYFKIMDPSRSTFFGTPYPSRPGSPPVTPTTSRPPSPLRNSRQFTRSHEKERTSRERGSSHDRIAHENSPTHEKSLHHGRLTSPRRRRPHFHLRFGPATHLHHSHHHHRHHHLFRELIQRGHENPVGIFESQRYLNLETRFHHPEGEALKERSMILIAESAEEILPACAEALAHMSRWLDRLNEERFWKLFRRIKVKRWEDCVVDCEAMSEKLRSALDEFRKVRRHAVLEPYRAYFEDPSDSSSSIGEPPPHRFLFQSFVYQYHLMQFAQHLCQMACKLDEICRLERERHYSRLWLPAIHRDFMKSWRKWVVFEHGDNDYEEDPEKIMGLDNELQFTSMEAYGRDPDALPPDNRFEAIGNNIFWILETLKRGSAVFAMKAAILTIVLSLPSFLPRTAKFAYVNKFVWAIFMGQLSLSRFRGDTTYELAARLLATLFGGLIGVVMWYISTGLGLGNAYGLLAISAICFPFFYFVRLYRPGPPMTKIIFLFTTQFVIGFSWQDNHLPTFANPGSGIQVGWKRLLLVGVGVFVAFLFSFLPPSTTIRRYIRTTYATTTAELGQLYCDIVSSASSHLYGAATEDVVTKLVAVRLKLKRSGMQRTNAAYEFSLRGRWPRERYQKVLEVQLEIAYLLYHLRAVVEDLEPLWATAFLQRTRFLDSDFQGDVLSVICMISTALRTGAPLPQITPCPLLDRFTAHDHGLHVLNITNGNGFRHGSEDEYGLPRRLGIETLENEQYLYFSVGVATAFGIITRLDRLMRATKELVGEQYHIHGLNVAGPRGRTMTTLMASNMGTVTSEISVAESGEA